IKAIIIDHQMEKAKQVGGSSASSFTSDLFGPKDSSSSSPSSSYGLFGSVFGPPSTGLGKDSSYSGFMGSVRKQDYESQNSNGKNGNPDLTNSKDKRYQSETVEPCNFSSSIYYGGQEVYSPTSQPTVSQHVFKKDGGDDDPNASNSNSASRGNWWQGSLYY
ncbi:hypothetical protein C3L33_23023, partial [Rhododendron williamsianum]